MNTSKKINLLFFVYLFALIPINIMTQETVLSVSRTEIRTLQETEPTWGIVGWEPEESVRHIIYSDKDTGWTGTKYHCIDGYNKKNFTTRVELEAKIPYALKIAELLDTHLSKPDFTNKYYLTYDQRMRLATFYNDFEKLIKTAQHQFALPKDAAENIDAKTERERNIEKLTSFLTKFQGHPFWKRELITELAYAAKPGEYPIEFVFNSGFSTRMQTSYTLAATDFSKLDTTKESTDPISAALNDARQKYEDANDKWKKVPPRGLWHLSFTEEENKIQVVYENAKAELDLILTLLAAKNDALHFIEAANAAHTANANAPYDTKRSEQFKTFIDAAIEKSLPIGKAEQTAHTAEELAVARKKSADTKAHEAIDIKKQALAAAESALKEASAEKTRLGTTEAGYPSFERRANIFGAAYTSAENTAINAYKTGEQNETAAQKKYEEAKKQLNEAEQQLTTNTKDLATAKSRIKTDLENAKKNTNDLKDSTVQEAKKTFALFDQTRMATTCNTTEISGVAAKVPAVKDAHVENAQELSSAESNYLAERKAKIWKGKLTIALCFSGGGYRAMISSAGFLWAAKNIGLLDAATYISTLSGSTWLVASLLAHHKFSTSETLKGILTKPDLSPFANHLKASTCIDLTTHYTQDEVAGIKMVLEHKRQMGQRVQMIDLWGALISQRLLGTQDVYLSQCKPLPEEFPYPIFTAIVNKNPGQTEALNRGWLTITPDNVEADFLNARIPLQTFGNWFMHDHQISKFPEQRLGFYLGTFGSAFAADITTILDNIKSGSGDLTENMGGVLKNLGDYISGFGESWKNIGNTTATIGTLVNRTAHKSLLAPLQPNFTYAPDDTSDNPILKKNSFEVCDAGLSINLPLIPLLNPKRAVDIIFVCDVSDDTCQEGTKGKLTQINAAKKYADANSLPFPDITNSTKINDGRLWIFKGDPANHIPTIVYFPNMVPFGTFKLQYTPQEFDQLYNYMRETVTDNQEIIKLVMQGSWEKLTSSRPTSPATPSPEAELSPSPTESDSEGGMIERKSAAAKS